MLRDHSLNSLSPNITYSSAEEFVRRKFFSLSNSEFEEYTRVYGEIHGIGPLNYMIGRYWGWRNGYNSMGPTTSIRMLECVPRIMTDDELCELALLEVSREIRNLKIKKKFPRDCNLEDVHIVFTRIINEICCNDCLNWFTRDVLSVEECEAFNDLAKYIIGLHLKSIYEGVVKDIELLRQIVHPMPYTATVSYAISCLGMNLSLSRGVALNDSIVIPFEPPKIYERFKEKVFKFIASQKIDMSNIEARGLINRKLSLLDAEKVVSEFERLKNGDEIKVHCAFSGESGLGEVSFERININTLENKVAVNRLYQLVSVVVLICFYGVLVVNELFLKCFPVSFIVFMVFLCFFCSYRDNVQKYKSEINNYGRKNI